MNIEVLLSDKTLKPKEKTETISRWLLEGALAMDELTSIAEKQKDPAKATCIEAIEFATKQQPGLADESILRFVTGTLSAKAPRIKWESAKVIGNIAHLFPGELEKPAIQLLVNAEHEGTVVRWSAAYALGEILKTKTLLSKKLFPQLEQICEKEEKNSIKKIYLAAFKKIK